MKYIKEYKDSNSEFDDIKQNIEDVLIDISHNTGLDRQSVSLVKDYKWHIFVNILDYHDDKIIKWIDIKNDILRINSVIIGIFKPRVVFYKEVQSDNRIFNRWEREVLDFNEFYDKMTDSSRLYFLSIEYQEI